MKRDFHQEVTNRIIEQLEVGTPPWHRPWQCGQAGVPLRSTGERYKGINVLLLWITAALEGYGSDHWLTYKQAAEMGGLVRKGEKSTPVVYFGQITREVEKTQEEYAVPFLRRYNVFNAPRIDALAAEYYPELVDTGTRAIDELEQFFDRVGFDLQEGNECCYQPSLDRVTMLPIQSFSVSHEYYGTSALWILCRCRYNIHWTGANSRSDRNHDSKHWECAFEELVAEMEPAWSVPRPVWHRITRKVRPISNPGLNV